MVLQVSALCNGISGSVNPYVILDSSNVTNDNAQYHNICTFTMNPCPDWCSLNRVLSIVVGALALG